MLAPLVLAFAAVTAVSAAAPADPIRVTLSGGARYATGEAGRVEVRAGRDGYLLVLQAEPNGAVRVLFPLDPRDNTEIEADATYQLRDRAGRAGVVRASLSGQGMVIAALSPDPWDFAPVTRGNRWNATALRVDDRDDLEYGLLDLAEKLAGGRVEHDAAAFSVEDWDDMQARRWGGGAPSYALGLGWGWGAGAWGAPLWYDPFWGWGYSPWAWGWGNGFGWGGGWGGGWGRGWGGGPIIIAPGGGGGGQFRPGYEVKGQGRTWGGRTNDGGGRVSGGNSGRQSDGGGRASGGSRGNGGGGAAAKGSGRSWGGGGGRNRR